MGLVPVLDLRTSRDLPCPNCSCCREDMCRWAVGHGQDCRRDLDGGLWTVVHCPCAGAWSQARLRLSGVPDG